MLMINSVVEHNHPSTGSETEFQGQQSRERIKVQTELGRGQRVLV